MMTHWLQCGSGVLADPRNLRGFLYEVWRACGEQAQAR